LQISGFLASYGVDADKSILILSKELSLAFLPILSKIGEVVWEPSKEFFTKI